MKRDALARSRAHMGTSAVIAPMNSLAFGLRVVCLGLALTPSAFAQGRTNRLNALLVHAMNGRQIPAMAMVVIRGGEIAEDARRGLTAGRGSRSVAAKASDEIERNVVPELAMNSSRPEGR